MEDSSYKSPNERLNEISRTERSLPILGREASLSNRANPGTSAVMPSILARQRKQKSHRGRTRAPGSNRHRSESSRKREASLSSMQSKSQSGTGSTQSELGCSSKGTGGACDHELWRIHLGSRSIC